MFKKIVFLALILTYIPLFSQFSFAINSCDLSQCNSEDNNYQQCLTDVSNFCSKQKDTLSNQIKIINSQYDLTLLRITQTENSIKNLEKEIDNLTVEINGLNTKLNQLSSLYVLQIIDNYKLQKKVPTFAFLFSSKLNTYLEQYKYVANVQKASQTSLINMETVRSNYDAQKTAKTQKQQEMETLQKTLATQKVSLTNQKKAKDQLLKVTEAEYNAIQSKLASLNNSSAGCLSSIPGGGIDGNYFSQIDPRWCPQFIGMQRTYTIGGAGCYLTSVSMVLKKIGEKENISELKNITPSIYAADPDRFTSSADLRSPKPPSGYSYQKILGYKSSTIDNELSADRYVVVQVPMRGSPSGHHFVTLISGSNGNYKMHDPIYGADKEFSKYYSTSSIVSMRLITK